MLKLPKGLKKKKKGKKSKKDKELFTEEELEQYKREHQKKELEASTEEATVSASGTASSNASATDTTNDDEWSKFKALTGGVDSILKQKQEDLDRIKSTSFFKRVPPPSEEKKKQEAQERKEAIVAEEEKEKAREEEKLNEEDIFKQAVVELSESESEEEEADDIFDTTYIDVIAAAEVGLVNVDSPTEEEDDGVDPFDTSYAEKVIKGPEVSKRGKKLVSIGSAVEVLTGRVESTSAVRSRRPRRGPKDLLLETPDAEGVNLDPSPEPIRTLLDDPADDIPNIPVDLSVSLHLALQKEKQKTDEQEKEVDLAEEFGVLKQSVDLSEDEFAQIAAESSNKKEVHILEKALVQPTEEGDWAFFEQTKGDKPLRPVTGPHIPAAVSDEDLSFREDSSDPFDTAFVERILPATLAEDLDFDPRAEDNFPEPEAEKNFDQFSPQEKKPDTDDLFKIHEEHLSQLAHNPLVPKSVRNDITLSDDPFDTSVIDAIVAPKKAELTLLESELLSNIPQELRHSLSDPDFDPRAEEEEIVIPTKQETVNKRKSSLVLNIHSVSSSPSRGVKFAANTGDLLKTDDHSEGHRKPLTPYYTKDPVALPETLSDESDPFDTSFVSDSKPTDVELNLLERDLLVESKLKHSLSDQEFDPRASSPKPAPVPIVKTDLLSANNDFSSKVLTPAVETRTFTSIDHFVDPFDTSNIESNIQPGKVELHLLADEFVPHVKIETDLFDTSQDTNHFFAGKVLTPQPTGLVRESVEEEDIDPFDTSFANNLAPGPSEIRVLETELIDN